MGKYELNKNLAQMLKGGVIMDVTNADQTYRLLGSCLDCCRFGI